MCNITFNIAQSRNSPPKKNALKNCHQARYIYTSMLPCSGFVNDCQKCLHILTKFVYAWFIMFTKLIEKSALGGLQHLLCSPLNKHPHPTCGDPAQGEAVRHHHQRWQELRPLSCLATSLAATSRCGHT